MTDVSPYLYFGKRLKPLRSNHREFTFPATIDDPQVIDEIKASLKELGLAGARKSD